jgi:hypothetical protein
MDALDLDSEDRDLHNRSGLHIGRHRTLKNKISSCARACFVEIARSAPPIKREVALRGSGSVGSVVADKR